MHAHHFFSALNAPSQARGLVVLLALFLPVVRPANNPGKYVLPHVAVAILLGLVMNCCSACSARSSRLSRSCKLASSNQLSGLLAVAGFCSSCVVASA